METLTKDRVQELFELLNSKNYQYKFIESLLDNREYTQLPENISENDKNDLIQLSQFIKRHYIIDSEIIVENPLDEYTNNNCSEDYETFLEDWSYEHDYCPELDYSQSYIELYKDYFNNVLPEACRIETYDFIANKTPQDFILDYVDNFAVYHKEMYFWSDYAEYQDDYNEIIEIANAISDFYNSSIIEIPDDYIPTQQRENEIYEKIFELCRSLSKDSAIALLENVKENL